MSFRSVTMILILLGLAGSAPPAFSRGGISTEDPWSSELINGLPAEIRRSLAQMCHGGPMKAQHYFALYWENSRRIELHFEYFRCTDQDSFCNANGCLHQTYILDDGHYRLLRSRYSLPND